MAKKRRYDRDVEPESRRINEIGERVGVITGKSSEELAAFDKLMRLTSKLGVLLLHDESVSKLLPKFEREKMNELLNQFDRIAVQYHSKYIQTKMHDDFPEKTEIHGGEKQQKRWQKKNR